MTIAPSGISVVPSDVSGQPRVISYGPAVASPAAFGPGGLTVGQVSWVALPSAAGIGDGDLSKLLRRGLSAGERRQRPRNENGDKRAARAPLNSDHMSPLPSHRRRLDV